MAARQAQPPRRYEAGTADGAGDFPGTPGGPSHTAFGPPHAVFNRVEDSEKKKLKEVE